MVLGIIFTILQGFDVLTTNIALKRGCVEGNPFLKKSVEKGFPLYLIIIKIGLGFYLTYLSVMLNGQSIFTTSFGGLMLNFVLIGLNFFLSIAVINNLIAIPRCHYISK